MSCNGHINVLRHATVIARPVICYPSFRFAFMVPDAVRKEIYAHFFLFRCEMCGDYLASVCSSSQSNLEPADAHIFNLQCHCGWSGELAGFAALRHWVDLGEYMDLAGAPHCSAGLAEAA